MSSQPAIDSTRFAGGVHRAPASDQRLHLHRPPCEPNATSNKVGLIAGWGRYPLIVVEALRQQGLETYCLAIKDHADPALEQICTAVEWCGVARLGQARRFFRRHGVLQLTMAGKIHKVKFYQPGYFLRHRPDWRGLCRFSSHFVFRRADRKDDTLLGAVVEELSLDGATFFPATDFAPDLLVPAGQLTERGPTAVQQRDIEFGWRLAKAMGGLDVGQSVMVKGQAALAVEAIEGTDLCIQRAGQLCPVGGFTVVKVAKPQQDMRFDVPTVGVQTVETMVAAGAAVLAVEAGKTILLDPQAVVELADRHGLAIVAVKDGSFSAG